MGNPGLALICLFLEIGGRIACAQSSQVTNLATGDKEARFAAILQAENQTPQNDYGLVVDQNGRPVAGADVQGNILLSSSFVTSSTEVHTTKTDARGFFEFVGLHGAKLGISIVKAGYDSSPAGFRKSTGGKQSTAKDRDTFVMWKLQGAEAMVHRRALLKLPCDNTAVDVDLLQGKAVASNGDVVIRFIRNPLQIIRGTPFEWTLILEVPRGGLSEIHDPYPYEAPKDGYQETVVRTTGANPKTYSPSTTQAYYYKSGDGKFGRLEVHLVADYQPPPTVIRIDSYVNIAGSRNLEYERTKDPDAPQLLH
jgi:hypothetical protein